MKLIIDIPDEEYNQIKEWEDNITGYQTSLVLYRAVRNGTPCEDGYTKGYSDGYSEGLKFAKALIGGWDR